MKQTIKFKTRELEKSIGKAAIFCGISKLMPILDTVHVNIKDGKMSMTSSNSESYISSTVNTVSAAQDCSFCVNGNDVQRAVNLISDEFTDIVIDTENHQMEIAHSHGWLTFQTYDADEFPMYSNSGECIHFETSSQLLQYIFTASRNFIGNDVLRPVMTGVYVHAYEGNIEFCATNASVLITDTVFANIPTNIDTEMIVGGNVTKAVMDIIGESDTVIVENYANVVVFRCGDSYAAIRKIEGKFPNFKVIVPNNEDQSYDKSMVVEIKRLLSAAKRCSISCASSNLLKFMLTSEKLKVQSENIDFGKKTVEDIEFKNANGEIEFGINAEYLSKCINVFDGDNVKIKMSLPNKAILFYDENGENPNRTILTMPMMIQ
jgi:DNA polymerase-3 subunit beta